MKFRHIRRWTWAHRATAALFLLLLILGRFDWFPWIKGSLSATRVFGSAWLADPMAALEIFLATQTLPEGLLIATGFLFVFYALIGRAFCGWVCPLGLVLDLNDDLRAGLNRSLRRRGLRLSEIRVPGSTKYTLLALALILSFVARLPAFQLVSPINILSRAFIFAPGGELILVAGIIALEYISPRVWCRAICPLGAFYSLLGRFGRLRVTIDQARENAGRGCGLCTIKCPMGIRVMEDHTQVGKASVGDMECTRCGACIDPCPRTSLSLGFGLTFSSTRARESSQKDSAKIRG